MPNYPDLQLFIGGEWKSADGQPVLNPADESVLGIVPHATRADLDAALAAAESGIPGLAQHLAGQARRHHPQGGGADPPAGRGDGGRHDARAGQADRAIPPRDPARLRHHRMGRDRRGGASMAASSRASRACATPCCASRSGVVAAFSPWNFPMSSPARKVGGRAVGRLLDHPQGLGGDAGGRGAARAGVP